MTQEQKVKAYDEALEIISDYYQKIKYSSLTSVSEDREVLERAFPQLKGLEDERIRKNITIALMSMEDNLVDFYSTHHTSQKELLAWLEKQGGQKAHLELKAGKWYICHRAYCCWADHLIVKEGERFLCQEDGVVKGFIIKEPEKYFREVSAPIEATTATYTTEVETGDGSIKALVTEKVVMPKFKTGDWAVSNLDKKARQISEVHFDEYNSYYVVDGKSVNLEEYDRLHHLWTIQDAKPGDVLQLGVVTAIFKEFIGNGNCKCYCSVWNGEFENLIENGEDNIYGCTNITPATIEQYDLLFSKMKEAGYEWDAEKKELKKIEQNPTEDVDLPEFESYLCLMFQKFRTKGMCTNGEIIDYVKEHSQKLRDILVKLAWSEEDEKILNSLIISLVRIGATTRTDSTSINYTFSREMDWLKSLKERYTWKPSDEQMNLLSDLVEDNNQRHFYTTLNSLYEQLKKLR